MTLGILFGGKSFEHEISIVSAIALKKVLTCRLVYIFCDSQREFYLIPTNSINAKLFSSGAYKKEQKLELKNGGFFTRGVFGVKKIECDCVMNVIHGTDGEDGKVASLFEFFKVPYIGPRLEASVLSYSKLLTKFMAQNAGVKTLSYQILTKEHRGLSLELPVIVKPLRLGSSIGVSIVKEQKELEYALDVAFEFDEQVLVEPFISGVKEFNLAGTKLGDNIHFSMVEEPQKSEMLDFEKKYMDFSRTQAIEKEGIDPKIEHLLRDSFVKLYSPLFDGAIIRCDFFMIDGEVYLNEINPNPGSMANYLFEDFDSMVHQLVKKLPSHKEPKVDYKYIHSIHSAKGKL